MRAVTRTTLALGELLEIPIGIAAATGSQEIKFDTALEDGAARVQRFVHPTRTRTLYELRDGAEGDDPRWPDDFESVAIADEVDPDEVVKGIRVGGKLRQVPESEVAAARASTKLDAVQVVEFVDYRKVPTDHLNGSFYLQPDPGFERPLRVLMEAMRRDGRAMVVKYSVRDRQRLGVVRVRSVHADGHRRDVLLLNDVVFSDQWRAPDAQVLAPAEVEAVDERAVESALQIMDGLAGDGKVFETARDDLVPEITAIVERAHMGVYDDPAQVLALAAEYHERDLFERGDQLVAWAEARWPELAEKREQVQQVLDEGGDGVGEKLAAIVG